MKETFLSYLFGLQNRKYHEKVQLILIRIAHISF